MSIWDWADKHPWLTAIMVLGHLACVLFAIVVADNHLANYFTVREREVESKGKERT